MIYQHPLAYLLGLEGLALLRGWVGDFDRDFVLDRLAEVRRLVDDPVLRAHEGIDVLRGGVDTAYRDWAPTYDDPSNGLFAIDAPIVGDILDGLVPGIAVDAACGTGRLTELLLARGHEVSGVDQSPEMLTIARRRFPEATFHVGDLHQLPLPDGAADVVVSGIALSHVADLAPVLREFARVLRPGGHLVISDAHHELILRGSIVRALGPAGEPGLVATYRHTPGDYLRAALPAGLEVRRCEEPMLPRADARTQVSPPPPTIEVGPADGWPWSLLAVVPEATRAAWAAPAMIVWDFERTT